ncbi:MAG: hypothetical protein R3B84_24565 [Zavarzinella sp.]
MTREFDSPWKETLENYLFVHFEVQAQRDPQLPERMFDYYCRIRQKYGKNVCSFAILADDDPRWRSAPFDLSICGTRSYFEFNLVKLLDYAERLDELTNHRSPVGLVVAASIRSLLTHGKADLRFADKARLIRQLFDRKLTSDEVWNIMRLLDWLLELPEELAEDFNKVRNEMMRENQMPFVTSFEQIAEKKGFKLGEERGREEGTMYGQRIGQIQLLAEMLGLPRISTDELQLKTLEELDRMISELKAKLIR